MMKGFRDSTKTVSGHHAPTGRSVGQVADFHSNMNGSPLVRRQTPTTDLDREAGGTSPLAPGYAKGGKPEKHFHVHHHYHGGEVTRSKARKMEMQAEKEHRGSEAKPYAKGGMHIKPENKGKFTKKVMGSKGAKLTEAGVQKGLHSKSGLERKEANFARMARRGFKPLSKADGGHIHDDTKPVAPDYATGGTINRMNAGGALYAKGGTVDEARKVAREEIHRHVQYPAPKGHKGMGKLIRGR